MLVMLLVRGLGLKNGRGKKMKNGQRGEHAQKTEPVDTTFHRKYSWEAQNKALCEDVGVVGYMGSLTDLGARWRL